jgi:dynein heavy chain 1
LEKSLLQALNDAKGKILDDDSVITSLETLKQEASEINKKVEETDKVIAEIETVLNSTCRCHKRAVTSISRWTH